MKKLCGLIGNLLSCPVFVNAGILGICAFSLGAALIAQYVYGLLPCPLCMIQRWFFVAAGVTGAAGLALALAKKTKPAALFVALSGLVFLGNSVVAAYHTGVERHWWRSFLEGCSVPDLGTTPEDLMNAIKNAPAVRCDVIPWADPWLGLSMANYNAIMCFGLAAGCFLCSIMIVCRINRG